VVHYLDRNAPPYYIVPTAAMVCGSNNCQLSEAIQNLPSELLEIIYKEYIAIYTVLMESSW